MENRSRGQTQNVFWGGGRKVEVGAGTPPPQSSSFAGTLAGLAAVCVCVCRLLEACALVWTSIGSWVGNKRSIFRRPKLTKNSRGTGWRLGSHTPYSTARDRVDGDSLPMHSFQKGNRRAKRETLRRNRDKINKKVTTTTTTRTTLWATASRNREEKKNYLLL